MSAGRPERVAIDGPAASGKTTLARRLAAQLGYLFLDTGVMYRAVTLAALRRGVPLDREQDVGEVARRVAVDVRPPSVEDGRQYDVLLDGEDVTWAIRTPQVDANVSQVSAYAAVRQAMGARQREIGLRGRVVMVGRDIGTVILPEAELKIYLDASAEERARRRAEEARGRGEAVDEAEILEAMRRRDAYDSSRALAPLRPADDAVVLDSTALTIEQVVERAVQLAGLAPAASAAPQEGEPAPPPFQHPWRVRLFRKLARPVFRGLFYLLARIEIEGLEHVPPRGGYLVCGNHLSIVDPPLVVAFWPAELEAAGAVDILARPFQGQLMRGYGAIPVHRGQADRTMLREAVRRLKAGRPLLIDPEGRRSHVAGMQAAHPGAAYLAARAQVPVVPVGVTGAESATAAWRRWRRGRLRMIVGKPLILPPVDLRSAARREALRRNTETIMRAVAALLPEGYRGLYG